MKLEYKVLSSFEKVFCKPEFTPELPLPEHPDFHGLRGSRVNCQLLLKCGENFCIRLSPSVPVPIRFSMREVGLIPSDMPGFPRDTDMLSTVPGLFPDALFPLESYIRLTWGNWHAVWISMDIPADCPVGIHEIKIGMELISTPGNPWKYPFEIQEEATFSLHVHAPVLPKQKLICANWFYCDCLQEYYHVKPWSRKFWKIAENYWRDMASHGRNMLLTPLWTVPLDTAVGHERPTAQLLKIALEHGKWRFDFSLLKEYFRRAEKCGIEYFEMSHLFSQWGAKTAPKIMVSVDGKECRYFGWDTGATSPEYSGFLAALLPELADFLKHEKMDGKVFFHISDEPHIDHIDQYRAASELVRKYLPEKEYPIMDALSDVSFLHRKLLNVPVPAIWDLKSFEKEKPFQRWCYYAGVRENYPGSCFSAPSRRIRILGILLYVTGMDGFLHWGHNFWFSQFSLRTDLNPYWETTSGRGTFSGGASNVYPGADGNPVASLRYEAFAEALQDLRLLQLAESVIGREETLKEIHQGLDYQLGMDHFPKSASYIKDLMERLMKRCEK